MIFDAAKPRRRLHETSIVLDAGSQTGGFLSESDGLGLIPGNSNEGTRLDSDCLEKEPGTLLLQVPQREVLCFPHNCRLRPRRQVLYSTFEDGCQQEISCKKPQAS